MSDNENAHPPMGGKSLETAMLTAGRPPYKSWRKKFRKMRADFDAVLEENKLLFKEEQKLEGLARRLTEELDGLMEILLDLNQSSAIPPILRFDVTFPGSQQPARELPPTSILPDNVQPEQANEIMQEYVNAVQSGRLPKLDLHVMRKHIQDRLAQQDIRPLPQSDLDVKEHGRENPEGHPSFLSAEQEDLYLARLDSAAPDSHRSTIEIPQPSHQADLTPRELERQMELLNPLSQHNWLKSHGKTHPVVDDDESMAEPPAKSSRKRPSGKNLARQVMMDRMVREGFSPSEMSGLGEDEFDDGTSRKRGGDKDSTFRTKSGRSGGSTKSKRKRTTDEGGAGGVKRMRASEIFD